MNTVILMLLITPLLVAVAIFGLWRVFQKLKKNKIARMKAELESIEKQIPEVVTSIIQESVFIKSMDKSADYDSDPWQSRRSKRWAEVNSNRALLSELGEREKQLKRELGIPSSSGASRC